MGRGEKSLLCGPGSELRLLIGSRTRRAKITKWDGKIEKNENKAKHV